MYSQIAYYIFNFIFVYVISLALEYKLHKGKDFEIFHSILNPWLIVGTQHISFKEIMN